MLPRLGTLTLGCAKAASTQALSWRDLYADEVNGKKVVTVRLEIMGRTPTQKPTKQERQRAATERWLARENVKKEQNRKARERMRRNRAIKKARSEELLPTEDRADVPYSPVLKYTRAERPSPVDPGTITSFNDAVLAFQVWTYDWGPAETWVEKYHSLLSKAIEETENPAFADMSEDFLSHVSEGWDLMEALRNLIINGEDGLDEHVFDTIAELVTELRFFERMDEEKCRNDARELRWERDYVSSSLYN
ncbi:hypothetical protein CONPUDRAFT_155211 [Coniophora puteana RWD-64-598 SS2]|uniref:Uncharacterized protein n=1 Tax=Coniophora puteana (strain RWD-64-598) TaxID=741705 RepID=A0A5M3ML71_CONPW|nr:uncharacterized protein CONPUDRAFT_155211 [Coniophora puteana RWD-64-598 SS2]EIW79816.1 hypothetical protein CONPUDRAFT_155211 [Coniophora puteana RWD-64-598 SS2]